MKPIYIKRDWNTHYSRRGISRLEWVVLWATSAYIVAVLLNIAWR